MKNRSDEEFFALCEYSLADPQTSARYLRNFTAKVIYIAVRHFGWVGLVVSYVLMVVRNSELSLPCFKHVAVLDIHAKLILRRDDIQAECRAVPIRRSHFPSRQILKELCVAYRRYIGLRSRTEFGNPRTSAPDTARLAATNHMYLVWLLYFYVHRSIILANAETVKSKIRTVLTPEEFTPLFTGYLSAFSDLGIPLILYLPGQLAQPDLVVQASPLFSKIIAKNGGAADFLHANGKKDVLLEESTFFNQRTPERKKYSIGGVFLASFYTLNDPQLTQFLTQSTVPYLRRFQETWHPISLRIFCHPNDSRARSTIERAGFDVYEAEPGKRLAGLDVVLSGNTSVIDEAIAADIPVVYSGRLDTYDYDLIGYVKEGVVLDGTYECPPQNVVEDFFGQPQTQAKLQRHRRGSGLHRLVRLIDEIQAEISMGPHENRGPTPCHE